MLTASPQPPAGGSPWRAGPWPLLGAAFVLRLLVGVGLYLAAFHRDPQDPLALLNSWLLAADATQYHVLAERCASFWQGQAATLSLGLPDKFLGYPILLGLLYRLLGAHPLWGVLLNCLAFLGISFLARRLALLLGQPPGRALALALAVALWPPSLAYSSTLLKDSLSLLGLFGILAGLAGLIAPPAPGPGPARRDGLQGLLLAGSCYLLAVIRPEFAMPILALSALSALWVLVAAPARRRSLWIAPLACLLAGDGLWQRRWEYSQTGGVSLTPEAHILPEGPLGLGLILAAGARDFLLSPYPWQSWPVAVENPWLKAGLKLQGLLWYLLLPGLAWGVAAALARRSPAGGAAALWVLALGLVLAFVVTNLGTLYRLRDLAALPALALFSWRPYE